MSFSNITQNAPLGWMNVQPMDAWYPAIEKLTAGNAATEAIAKNTVVFCEGERGAT